jgi:N-acyl-D-aspartate/D-glutamate deacylase
MSHTFTRQELFDLVWSAPTRAVAKQLGISDVGLAKAGRRADLLLPPRGYWAKLAAGKPVRKPQLPTRGPGMSDRIVLGQSRWS